jgi:hypothetical protein
MPVVPRRFGLSQGELLVALHFVKRPSVVIERAFFLRWLCHRPLPAAGEAKLSFCSEQLRFHAMTSLIQTKTRRLTGT